VASEIGTLISEIESQRSDIKPPTLEYGILSSEIEPLTLTYDSLSSEIGSLTSEIDTLRPEIDILASEIEILLSGKDPSSYPSCGSASTSLFRINRFNISSHSNLLCLLAFLVPLIFKKHKIMSKTSVKVEIPEHKPDDLIKLADTALAKHTALGASSPIKALDIETFTENLNVGKDKRVQAKKLHDEAEALNQQAGLNLGIDKTQNAKTPGTVYSTLTSIRDILLGIYKGQEKKLNEWGFDVVISEVSRKSNNVTK
jgi:hypothetical protein